MFGDWQKSIKLWEPDAVMPAQMLHRPKLRPEQCLALAILEDAYWQLRGVDKYTDRKSAQVRRDEAVRWLYAKEPEHVFSFENICEMFGLDPGKLRKALLSLASAALPGN